jgi:hypothetical protein
MSTPTRGGWYAVWFPTPVEGRWLPQVFYCFHDTRRLMAAARGALRPLVAPVTELLEGADWLGPFLSETVARATAGAMARRSA